MLNAVQATVHLCSEAASALCDSREVGDTVICCILNHTLANM